MGTRVVDLGAGTGGGGGGGGGGGAGAVVEGTIVVVGVVLEVGGVADVVDVVDVVVGTATFAARGLGTSSIGTTLDGSSGTALASTITNPTPSATDAAKTVVTASTRSSRRSPTTPPVLFTTRAWRHRRGTT